MYEGEKEKSCAKEPQVQRELVLTKKIVAETTEVIIRLSSQLMPIMRIVPEDVEPTNKVEKELVPLAREMSEINKDLEINCRRLSMVLDLLEL